MLGHCACRADASVRPANHQESEWSPERLTRWACNAFGPHTEKLVEAILALRAYPEQGYRACLGILRLGKRCGPERLEAPCRRALHFGVRSYPGVKNILDNRLEELPLPPQSPELPLGPHENVRGKGYFTGRR